MSGIALGRAVKPIWGLIADRIIGAVRVGVRERMAPMPKLNKWS
jgi:hypothetical protein